MQQVSQETRKPYTTISGYQQELCKNMRSHPFAHKCMQRSRIFTDADFIAGYIVAKWDYIQQGAYLTNDDFIDIATSAWDKYHPTINSSEEERRKKNFKSFSLSHSFNQYFKYYHTFSSKVIHFKQCADPNS